MRSALPGSGVAFEDRRHRHKVPSSGADQPDQEITCRATPQEVGSFHLGAPVNQSSPAVSQARQGGSLAYRTRRSENARGCRIGYPSPSMLPSRWRQLERSGSFLPRPGMHPRARWESWEPRAVKLERRIPSRLLVRLSRPRSVLEIHLTRGARIINHVSILL